METIEHWGSKPATRQALLPCAAGPRSQGLKHSRPVARVQVRIQSSRCACSEASESAIAGSLQFEHLGIAATHMGQLVVSSLFYDSAAFKYYDAVRHTHG